jgi:hypothetical protein
MIAESYALFKKDFHSELRTRYAINSLAMFIIVAISVILFSIGNEAITESLTGGLFWVVIFFTAMSGLSRAFVSEEERGTTLTLQLIASPTTKFPSLFIDVYFRKYRPGSCFYNYRCNYCKSRCKRNTLSRPFLSDFITFDSYLCSINFVLVRWYKL